MNFKLLKAGEKIPTSFQEKLAKANAKRAKSFPEYVQSLRDLGSFSEPIYLPKLTEKHKIFLGGFVLGEGSLNASAKKGKFSVSGLYLDLEFSVTQHLNRFSHMVCFLELFGCGRISHKNGSNATLVFRIGDRTLLWQKVIPYWEKYVLPYSSDGATQSRFKLFKNLILAFREGKHKVPTSFMEEMLPFWDEMRQQKGQSNESFKNLSQAREYVKQHVERKAQGLTQVKKVSFT